MSEKGDSRHSILLSDGTTVTFDLFIPDMQQSRKQSRGLYIYLFIYFTKIMIKIGSLGQIV